MPPNDPTQFHSPTDPSVCVRDLRRLLNTLEHAQAESRRLVPLVQQHPLACPCVICSGGGRGLRLAMSLIALTASLHSHIHVLRSEIQR